MWFCCTERMRCAHFPYNAAVNCMTHLLTPGKGPSWVRHVPLYWWHMVPSRTQMVRHKIDPYVCHGPSKYHESVISLHGESQLHIISASMWVKWCVTLCDGGCVMVHKRMTHIGTMTHHSRGSIGASYNWQLHKHLNKRKSLLIQGVVILKQAMPWQCNLYRALENFVS